MDVMRDQAAVPGIPAPRDGDVPRRRFGSAGTRHDAAYAISLKDELARLREENALLRAEFSRSTGAQAADELLALSGQRSVDQLDHIATQAVAMRDDLVEVCKELGQTTITLQTRLHGVRPDLPDHSLPDTLPMNGSVWIDPAGSIRYVRAGGPDDASALSLPGRAEK